MSKYVHYFIVLSIVNYNFVLYIIYIKPRSYAVKDSWNDTYLKFKCISKNFKLHVFFIVSVSYLQLVLPYHFFFFYHQQVCILEN
jgi:hypothetical protein